MLRLPKRPSDRLAVAALALEWGRRVARLNHHGGCFAALAALARELGRKVDDRLCRVCNRLIGLGAELGLGQHGSSALVCHAVSLAGTGRSINPVWQPPPQRRPAARTAAWRPRRGYWPPDHRRRARASRRRRAASD